MNVHLRERNRNSVLVESFFNGFVHIEQNVPVVVGLAPHGAKEVDTACRVFGYARLGCGVFKNFRVFGCDFLYDVGSFVEVVRIRNRVREIDSTNVLFRVVYYFARGEFTVRKIDDFVVVRADFSVADKNVLDRAFVAVSRDKVAVAERAG